MSDRVIRPGTGLLVALVLPVSTAAAAAPEPGVTVDPDSPAGKEYAIPIEGPRSLGDPERREPSTSLSGSGLFGFGVTPGPGAAEAAGGEDPTEATSGQGPQGTQGDSELDPDGAQRSDAPRAADTSTTAKASSFAFGAGGVAVAMGGGLLLALVLTLMRRRRA